MTTTGASGVGTFLAVLTRIESAIAVGGLFITAGALLSDIFAREVLQTSLFGSLRVAVYATAFAALFGFTVCVGSNSHIRVTIFDGITPKNWQPFLYRLADVISFLICAAFAYFSADFVWQTFLVSETDVALNIVIWPLQLVLPWMFISAGIRYALYAIFPSVRPQEIEVIA